MQLLGEFCENIVLKLVNPFVHNAPFLYPLKTENRKVLWCFQGVDKGYIGKKWV